VKITTVGLDLAKNVIQVHGVDERGKTVLKRQLKRDQVASFFANMPACLVGMEACGSAHHWARKLQSLGHEVKLMAPQFVKPYVKTNKNDVADAEAICEAVARPNMRFVPIKTAEQQSVLSLHRARQAFVKARTAQGNQIRGLLNEYGIVIPQGIGHVTRRLALEGNRSSGGRVGARNQNLAPRKRSQSQTGEDSGDRCAHGERLDRIDRRCELLHKRASDGCLARFGSQAALDGRKSDAPGYQQAR
jgi:transposase